MIKLNVDELLKRRGKTRYWLSRQSGISYQNICKMVGNETTGIRFDTLECFCLIFECTPNDLFTITED